MLAIIPLALIYILVSCLMACGPVNVDARGNPVPDAASGPTGGTAPTGSPAPAAAPAAPVSAAATPTPAVIDGSTAPADEPACGVKTAPIQGSTNLVWEEAKAAAPEGYHLATRGELYTLVDNGFFKPELNVVFWTSTSISDTEAVAIFTVNKNNLPEPKHIPLSALYVRN